jgi:hypothetical protein
VCFSQHLCRSATPKIPGQALPCHHSDADTHHLNRGHQRPGQECSPEKRGSKLRARHGICGNARWVIVGRPGDNARAKRLQQQSHPSSWSKCRHEKVGAQTAYESRLGSAHNPTGGAVQIDRFRVVQCDQTSVFASSNILHSEEVRRPLQRPVSFPLQVRDNMETLLIVLVVLFLLGGGDWGYSRWRG